MKNVLFLTSGYCGKVTANGFCAKKLVECLENNGANVFVISLDKQSNLLNCEEHVYSVIATPSRANKNFLNKLYLFLKEAVFVSKGKKELIKKISNLGMELFKNVKFDAIISMYFPAEALAAGKQLKKQFSDSQFLIYELDSVGDGITSGSKLAKWIDLSYRRFLSGVYSEADHIIILNSHKAYWFHHFKKYTNKVTITDLPLLSISRSDTIKTNTSRVRCIYTGILNEIYRSPELLLQSFLNIDHRMKYELHFYSKGCEEVLLNAAQKNDSVYLHGYVEQEILKNAMDEAEFFINLGNAVSNSVPSKLINYISTGKPIIHFLNQKDDVCVNYLEKYSLALIIKKEEQPRIAAEKIMNFILETRGKTVSEEILKKNYLMNLPEYSANIIISNLGD